MLYLVLASFIGVGLWLLIFTILISYVVNKKKKKAKKDFENLFK